MTLTQINPLDGFRLWLRYEDGTEGTVDLSALARRGVFAAWQQPGVFAQARLVGSRAVAWGDDLDLCADALYLRLTGKTPEEAFPRLQAAAHA